MDMQFWAFDLTCCTVLRSFSLPQKLVGFLRHNLAEFGYIPFDVPSTLRLGDIKFTNLQLLALAQHSGRMVFTANCPALAVGETVVVKLAKEDLITREVRDAGLRRVSVHLYHPETTSVCFIALQRSARGRCIR